MDAATDWVVSGGRYALDFDGTNDCFSVSALRGTETVVTLSTWVNILTYNNLDDFLCEHTTNYNSNDGFISDPCGSGGTWAVGLTSTGTLPAFTSYSVWTFPRPTAGVWNHVSTIFDRTKGLAATGLRTFVNGIEQTLTSGFITGTISGAFANASTFFMSRANSSLFLNAQLADAMLHNRSLSPQEIRLLATRPGIAYERRKRKQVYVPQTSARRRKILTGQV